MNKLKELRQAKGLTLRELGEALNVSYTSLSKVENGQRNLNDVDIKLLCDYFECSADYLLGRTEFNENVSKEQEELPQLSVQERYILDSIKTLTKEQLQELIKYIEFLKLKELLPGVGNASL